MNTEQLARARRRQEAVAAALPLKKQGLSLKTIARQVGIPWPTLHCWLVKYPTADLPIEYYSDGFKKPLPPATQLQLAEEAFRMSGANVVEASKHLRNAVASFQWAKRNHEANRQRLIELSQ